MQVPQGGAGGRRALRDARCAIPQRGGQSTHEAAVDERAQSEGPFRQRLAVGRVRSQSAESCSALNPRIREGLPSSQDLQSDRDGIPVPNVVANDDAARDPLGRERRVALVLGPRVSRISSSWLACVQ